MSRRTPRVSRFIRYALLLLGLLALSACGGSQGAEPVPSSALEGEPSPAAALAQLDGPDNSTAAATASPTAVPTSTAAPSPTPTPLPTATPTATPSPTPTPVPTDTATPTPTPTPLHPLAIEAMRQQAYPGSEITIEETLEPGANYDRYIASYVSEGAKIYALLTVPRGQKPEGGWPVILFNHGYIPPEQYRTTERYVSYVDALARQGYIVLRSDYRGHGNSEGEASSNYASPGYTVDVLNAVAAIQDYPDADRDRIGMWGHSMGGGIALRAMVTTSDVKAGVIWAGTVASPAELLQRRWGLEAGGSNPLPTLDPDSRRWDWIPEMLDTYGTPEENPEFYAAIAPNTYLRDLSGPIQLHHGSADTSVPVEYSEMLHAQMQAAGMPSDLYVYKGDNHNISANFATAMARSIQFFDTYVKGAGSDQ